MRRPWHRSGYAALLLAGSLGSGCRGAPTARRAGEPFSTDLSIRRQLVRKDRLHADASAEESAESWASWAPFVDLFPAAPLAEAAAENVGIIVRAASASREPGHAEQDEEEWDSEHGEEAYSDEGAHGEEAHGGEEEHGEEWHSEEEHDGSPGGPPHPMQRSTVQGQQQSVSAFHAPQTPTLQSQHAPPGDDLSSANRVVMEIRRIFLSNDPLRATQPPSTAPSPCSRSAAARANKAESTNADGWEDDSEDEVDEEDEPDREVKGSDVKGFTHEVLVHVILDGIAPATFDAMIDIKARVLVDIQRILSEHVRQWMANRDDELRAAKRNSTHAPYQVRLEEQGGGTVSKGSAQHTSIDAHIMAMSRDDGNHILSYITFGKELQALIGELKAALDVSGGNAFKGFGSQGVQVRISLDKDTHARTPPSAGPPQPSAGPPQPSPAFHKRLRAEVTTIVSASGVDLRDEKNKLDCMRKAYATAIHAAFKDMIGMEQRITMLYDHRLGYDMVQTTATVVCPYRELGVAVKGNIDNQRKVAQARLASGITSGLVACGTKKPGVETVIGQPWLLIRDEPPRASGPVFPLHAKFRLNYISRDALAATGKGNFIKEGFRTQAMMAIQRFGGNRVNASREAESLSFWIHGGNTLQVRCKLLFDDKKDRDASVLSLNANSAFSVRFLQKWFDEVSPLATHDEIDHPKVMFVEATGANSPSGPGASPAYKEHIVTLFVDVSNISWQDLSVSPEAWVDFDDAIMAGIYNAGGLSVTVRDEIGRYNRRDYNRGVQMRVDWMVGVGLGGAQAAKHLKDMLERREAQICEQASFNVRYEVAVNYKFVDVVLGHPRMKFVGNPRIWQRNQSNLAINGRPAQSTVNNVKLNPKSLLVNGLDRLNGTAFGDSAVQSSISSNASSAVRSSSLAKVVAPLPVQGLVPRPQPGAAIAQKQVAVPAAPQAVSAPDPSVTQLGGDDLPGGRRREGRRDGGLLAVDTGGEQQPRGQQSAAAPPSPEARESMALEPSPRSLAAPTAADSPQALARTASVAALMGQVAAVGPHGPAAPSQAPSSSAAGGPGTDLPQTLAFPQVGIAAAASSSGGAAPHLGIKAPVAEALAQGPVANATESRGAQALVETAGAVYGVNTPAVATSWGGRAPPRLASSGTAAPPVVTPVAAAFEQGPATNASWSWGAPALAETAGAHEDGTASGAQQHLASGGNEAPVATPAATALAQGLIADAIGSLATQAPAETTSAHDGGRPSEGQGAARAAGAVGSVLPLAGAAALVHGHTAGAKAPAIRRVSEGQGAVITARPGPPPATASIG
mmetsp:Transcript_18925/g.54797  ORF Transcript_18925/g.54797 Transcript_18925/m.54797 type:complete len:1308 (+) Transcript_18925:121-4044(+)